ncbi:MAG: hypothetical protein ACJ74W_01270 [Pyrinomonadaceae bacterium]
MSQDVENITRQYQAAINLTAPARRQTHKTARARTLEARGYEAWLQTLGARSFARPFAYFHHEFWGWYWPVRMKLLRGAALEPAELAMLLMWFRGGGKSTHVEWACIAEGALG